MQNSSGGYKNEEGDEEGNNWTITDVCPSLTISRYFICCSFNMGSKVIRVGVIEICGALVGGGGVGVGIPSLFFSWVSLRSR